LEGLMRYWSNFQSQHIIGRWTCGD